MIGILMWAAMQVGQPSATAVVEGAQSLIAANQRDEAIALLLQEGGASPSLQAALSPLLRQLSADPATSPRAAGIAADAAEAWGDHQPQATAAALLRWSKDRDAHDDVAHARGLALRAARFDPTGEAVGYANSIEGRDLYGVATGMWLITSISAITGASGLFVASSADANVRARQHERDQVNSLLTARTVGSITSAVGAAAAVTAGIAAVALTLLHDPAPAPVEPKPLQPLDILIGSTAMVQP
jgi:hypothetical protein